MSLQPKLFKQRPFLFGRAASTSGAIYLVAIVSAWLYVTHGGPPPPPNVIRCQKFQNENMFQTILSTFYFWETPDHFKSEFFIHSYIFYNFQMAITPKISQIDTWFKIEDSFIFGHLNTF